MFYKLTSFSPVLLYPEQPAKQGEKYVDLPSGPQTGVYTSFVHLQSTLHSFCKLKLEKVYLYLIA